MPDEDVDELIERGCDLADLGEHEAALPLFRRAAERGSAVAWFDLGNSLMALRRWDEAADAHRRAAVDGEDDAWLNLSIALLEAGRWVAAEHAARRGVDAGDPKAWAPLGSALLEQGHVSRAERAFRSGAELGDGQAALSLAYLLRQEGRESDAWGWAQRAADAGDLQAVGVLAHWRWEQSRDPALEPDLRAGADDHEDARLGLAELLRTEGRIEEARTVLERGAMRGETDCWLPLGNLYWDELGDPVGAEAAYRAGIEGGDLYSSHNLGVLFSDLGDLPRAIEHLTVAAEGGDDLAAQVLRRLLDGE